MGGGVSTRLQFKVATSNIDACSPSPCIDEATSALDYESERVIQDNMREIVRGRTVIIIAHRLSAVQQCDRIITIDSGRIVEDGLREDLARSGGRFAAMLRSQGAPHAV
jgi:ATP-binding cassette, subfamily B, bacterial HlyB/CyaB